MFVSINVPGIDVPIEMNLSNELWEKIEKFSRENYISTEEAIVKALYDSLLADDEDE